MTGTYLNRLGRIFISLVCFVALSLSAPLLQAQETSSEQGAQPGERAERPPRAERNQSGERPRGGGGRGPRRPPPPRANDGSREAGTPKYTAAPDGIGVTMRDGASPNPYTKETVSYVPWEDGSKMNPIKVGAKLPKGSVVFTKDGKKLDLNKTVMETPTLLIYYRGGWCPYCNIQLHELKNAVPALEEMGYQLLAVSTDTVEALKEYDDSELNYQLLSDPDLTLATHLGIKYKVVKQYLDHMAAMPDGRAFSLEERNGGFLVTPSAFVLDTTGTVRFAYLNDNYTVRASEEALLKAAKEALEN